MDSASSIGSIVCTAFQNMLTGPLPRAWSQTFAATMPPGLVTLAISAMPATGSFMKWTTS